MSCSTKCTIALSLVCAAAASRADAQQSPKIPEHARLGTGLSASDADDGWISLFDGTSLFGWKAESDANWRAEDGCIVVDQGSEPGLLRTTTQFDDYELRLDFAAGPETNSGVFVRTSPSPANPTVDCLEVNIAPADNPFPTGSIVARAKASAMLKPSDEWHSLSIQVRDRSVSVEVDGGSMAGVQDALPAGRGYIGLQFNQGPVRFRNIRLKPSQLEPMFNGADLDGWKSYDVMTARFAVDEPALIHVRGGPGQLESSEAYADFVFQFKFRTNAIGLNSGVFFRCIPGEQMNGYEVQIDNSIADNDPTKPRNAGTGAIFRRTEARRVMSSDLEWNAVTLVAEGPHFAVWVNGAQVTDWTDERSPDPNPRRGRRMDAGTIMLQAHDPSTDVHFAELAIIELRPRERSDD
jgi:hypothetical protein